MSTNSIRTLIMLLLLVAVPAGADPKPAAAPAQCHAGKTRARFAIDFKAPEQAAVGTAVLRINYRGDQLSLPGTGTAKTVQQRIASPQHAVMAFNALDSALRVVAGRSPSLSAGQLFIVEFDQCAGAAAPSAADLSCTVEACAGSTGPVDGCACSIDSARS